MLSTPENLAWRAANQFKLRDWATQISSQTICLASMSDQDPQRDRIRSERDAAEREAVEFFATLPEAERLHARPVIAHGMSRALLAMCPDAQGNTTTLSRSTVDQLHIWLEPGLLTLCRDKGISFEGMYIELMSAIGKTEGCDDELHDLARTGYFVDSASLLLTRHEFYHMRSTECLAQIFKMIVTRHPIASGFSLISSLYSDQHHLSVALALCGITPAPSMSRSRHSAESKAIVEMSSSSHGRLGLQARYGSFEQQIEKLQHISRGKVGQMTK